MLLSSIQLYSTYLIYFIFISNFLLMGVFYLLFTLRFFCAISAYFYYGCFQLFPFQYWWACFTIHATLGIILSAILYFHVLWFGSFTTLCFSYYASLIVLSLCSSCSYFNCACSHSAYLMLIVVFPSPFDYFPFYLNLIRSIIHSFTLCYYVIFVFVLII